MLTASQGGKFGHNVDIMSTSSVSSAGLSPPPPREFSNLIHLRIHLVSNMMYVAGIEIMYKILVWQPTHSIFEV